LRHVDGELNGRRSIRRHRGRRADRARARAARFVEMGALILGGTPAEFGKMIADETEKWGKVVRFAGAKVD
jgi:hypothetical protein